MSGAKTTVEFGVTVDTSKAQAPLEGLKGGLADAGGAAEILDKRIERLTNDMESLSKAIVSGKGNTAAYKEQMRRLSDEMDALEGTTKGVSTASGQLDTHVQKLKTDITQLTSAILSGKGNTNLYRQQLNRLTMEMQALESSAGRAHGSFTRIGTASRSGARGATNFGQAALESSRALEDLQYGINGVVNNIPSLVMALGGTAGAAGAASLAAVAVNQIVKNFIMVPSAAEKAAKKSVDAIGTLRDELADLDSELKALASGGSVELAKARAQQAAAETKAAAVGSAFKARFGDVTADRREMDRIQSLAIEDRKVSLRVWNDEKQVLEDVYVAAKDVMDAYNTAMVAGTEAAMAKAKADRIIQKNQLEELQRLDDLADKEEERDRKRSARASSRAAAKDERQAAKDAKREADDAAKEAERVRKDNADMARIEFENQQREAKILSDMEQEQLKIRADNERAWQAQIEAQEVEHFNRRKAAREGFDKDMGTLAINQMGIVINAFDQMMQDAAANEDKILERFTVNVMKQAGQSLVSTGIQTLGKGIAYASDVVTAPLAAAPIATGSALIAAGIGLGATGAGLGASFGLGAKAGKKDRGASPRRDNEVDRQGLTVNVSYGVGGPLPEDTAREIQKAQEAAGRR
jgi:hypothetical protein